jgi:hypothetical protein
VLLKAGLIKQSYAMEGKEQDVIDESAEEGNFNHRLEMCKELLFLLPIIAGAVVAFLIFKKSGAAGEFWEGFSQKAAINGFWEAFETSDELSARARVHDAAASTPPPAAAKRRART